MFTLLVYCDGVKNRATQLNFDRRDDLGEAIKICEKHNWSYTVILPDSDGTYTEDDQGNWHEVLNPPYNGWLDRGID